MRVTRALRQWGYPGAGTFSMWSCVRNPLSGPKHALPIGFVQSPLLASLVLMKSEVAEAIERARAKGVCISVYLDDFIGSHDDQALLTAAYEDIRDTCCCRRIHPQSQQANIASGRDYRFQLRSHEWHGRSDRSSGREVFRLDGSHAALGRRI
jgi:hypothetical protein